MLPAAKRPRLDGGGAPPAAAQLTQAVTRALMMSSADVLNEHMKGDSAERQVRTARRRGARGGATARARMPVCPLRHAFIV
jgi:ribosomal protein S9